MTGGLVYYDSAAGSWTSGLDTTEWNTLWAYEAAFGVRQVTSYTVAGQLSPDSYGMNYVGYQDVTNQSLTATFTDAGKPGLRRRLTRAVQLRSQIHGSTSGPSIDPAVTTPLLSRPKATPLASITTYPDGRQNLAITAGNNPNLIHSLQLSYGTINWVTKGLFAGYRKAWIDPQIDDLFIDSDMWNIAAMSDYDRADLPPVRRPISPRPSSGRTMCVRSTRWRPP